MAIVLQYRHARTCASLILLVAGVAFSRNAVASPGADSALELIQEAQADHRLHGAVSVTEAKGEPSRLFSGSAAHPDGGAIDAQSKFRLASLTKIFTQLALLRLAEQGKIDLDAPLSTYRPNLKADWTSKVTVRQLLAFRSGLPREFGESSETAGVIFDDKGMALPFLDTLGHVGPVVEPGSQTQYSNLGYMHLGAVIESVTGEPYARAVKLLVIEPAGLHETGFGMDALGGDGHVRGHQTAADGTTTPVDQFPIAQRYAAGGMYGSLRDLETLSSAILDGKLLSDKSTDALFTQFGRLDDANRLQANGHVPGFANVWVISRSPRYTVIMLNNSVGTSPAAVVRVLRNVMKRLSTDQAAAPKPNALTKEGWTPVSGFDDVPAHSSLPVIRGYVNALLTSDVAGAFDALCTLHGIDPVTLDAGDRQSLEKTAAYELDVMKRFGPFSVDAWRMGAKQKLELHLQGPEGRAIEFGFTPSTKTPSIISDKRHGTVGFMP